MIQFTRTEEKAPENGMDSDVPVSDGEHLLFIEKILGPKESNSKPGNFNYFVVFRSVDEGGSLLYPMACTATGMLLEGKENGWRGQVRYNNLAEALGLPMGTHAENQILHGVIRGVVKSRGRFQNIIKMWTASDEDIERAAQWSMDNIEGN